MKLKESAPLLVRLDRPEDLHATSGRSGASPLVVINESRRDGAYEPRRDGAYEPRRDGAYESRRDGAYESRRDGPYESESLIFPANARSSDMVYTEIGGPL